MNVQLRDPKEIMKLTSAEIGDSIFFSCGKIKDVEKISSLARDKIARDLNIIDQNKFAFCWMFTNTFHFNSTFFV